MERFAASVTLLFLVGLLSGGVPAASAADGCESATSGFPMRGAANHLAAAACVTGTTTTTHAVQGAPACDSPLMASQLTKLCAIATDVPTAVCCAAVLMTVDQDAQCLCRVAEEPELALSDISVAQVWEWYKSCGGRRRSVPQDDSSCESRSAPPPSSPPPPPPAAAKPETPSAWPVRVWVAVGLLSAAAIATAIFGGLKLWLSRTVQAPAPPMDKGQALGQDQDQDQDIATGVPPGPGEVRPGAHQEDPATTGNPIAIAIGQSATTCSGEEKVSPPVSPLRVQQMQLARARRPTLPFEPLLLPPGPVQLPPTLQFEHLQLPGPPAPAVAPVPPLVFAV